MSVDLKASDSLGRNTVQKPAFSPESLQKSLAMVDEAFGTERILSASDSEFVASYYRQSLPGYSKIYNRWQCMHVALHEQGDSDETAYFAQAAAVSEYLIGTAGQRVLELGCGLGANTVHLATQHPESEFVGVDLMPEHVARASAKALSVGNASFRCASFEDLPNDLGTFDVIFAVESLCYANDLKRVAEQIVHLLRPGGHVVVFDAHRKKGFATVPAELVTAARLYEITTAVTRGFHPVGAWEHAFEAAGLTPVASDDITWKTLTGLSSLHRRSTKAFTDLKWRMALKLMPRYLARNTVAGLLGYHVCFGDGAHPDPERGAVQYQKIVARKPTT